MPVLQPIHRSGTYSHTQARNLLNDVSIPASTRHDLNMCAIQDVYINQPVTSRLATLTAWQAGIEVCDGEQFYLVRSRLEMHRFYVLVRRDGQWQCSSKNEAVAKMCVKQVERYIASIANAAAA